MLTKISNDTWVDLTEVFLVDDSSDPRETRIFIRPHPTCPIIIKHPLEREYCHEVLASHFPNAETKINLANIEKNEPVKEFQCQFCYDIMLEADLKPMIQHQVAVEDYICLGCVEKL